MRRPEHMRDMRGFTLMEVLVSMALLALLMLGLGSAMRAMGQAETRIQQRIDEADDQRLAFDFLTQVLARASARPPLGAPSGVAAMIEAGPTGMAWVGVLPARYGLGGRHFMRLAIESVKPSGAALVLRYVPWEDRPQFPDWASAPAQLIVADVASVAFRFLDGRSGQWVDHWPMMVVGTARRDPLPAAVEVQLDAGAAPWPLLVSRMAALPATDPSATPFTVGGGAR